MRDFITVGHVATALICVASFPFITENVFFYIGAMFVVYEIGYAGF